jgi:hypothetical protein
VAYGVVRRGVEQADVQLSGAAQRGGQVATVSGSRDGAEGRGSGAVGCASTRQSQEPREGQRG